MCILHDKKWVLCKETRIPHRENYDHMVKNTCSIKKSVPCNQNCEMHNQKCRQLDE